MPKNIASPKAGKSLKEPAVSRETNLWYYLLAVLLITLIVFYPSVGNTYICWDDPNYVYGNDILAKPLSGSIPYFFKLHYFLGGYTPVTMTVYALIHQVSGYEPQAYHIVNIVLHLADVALVFWLVYLVSGRRHSVAFITSLLFGIHPMHAESVLWVAELKDMLYGAFFLSGLISYWKYLEEGVALQLQDGKAGVAAGANRYLVYAFLFFTLSILSKPAAAVFPVVLLLLDICKQRKIDARAVLEKLPFIAISVVLGIITLQGQSTYNLMANDLTIVQRIVFASYSVVFFIWKLFVPAPLSMLYPYPDVANGHIPAMYYLASLGVFVLLYAVYRSWKQQRYVAFGILFFLVNIVLMLQFLSASMSVVADHYTYISYIGLFYILATGIDKVYHAGSERSQKMRQPIIMISTIFFVFCAYVSYTRCAVWQNDETMSADMVGQYPDNAIALNNRGYYFYNVQRYADAVPILEKALTIDPGYAFAHVNLINSYIDMNDQSNAAKAIDAALTRIPGNADVLTSKGSLALVRNDYAGGIKAYSDAIAAKPDIRNAYAGMSRCYMSMGDMNEAVAILDKGLSVLQGNFVLLNTKGDVFMAAERYPEALACYEASLRESPYNPVAENGVDQCRTAMEK